MANAHRTRPPDQPHRRPAAKAGLVQEGDVNPTAVREPDDRRPAAGVLGWRWAGRGDGAAWRLISAACVMTNPPLPALVRGPPPSRTRTRPATSHGICPRPALSQLSELGVVAYDAQQLDAAIFAQGEARLVGQGSYGAVYRCASACTCAACAAAWRQMAWQNFPVLDGARAGGRAWGWATAEVSQRVQERARMCTRPRPACSRSLSLSFFLLVPC